jgi:hypothetical protein
MRRILRGCVLGALTGKVIEPAKKETAATKQKKQ